MFKLSSKDIIVIVLFMVYLDEGQTEFDFNVDFSLS